MASADTDTMELPKSAKFSISGENLRKTPEKEPTLGVGNGPTRSASRFKVAKVEFVNDKPETRIAGSAGDATDAGTGPQKAAAAAAGRGDNEGTGGNSNDAGSPVPSHAGTNGEIPASGSGRRSRLESQCSVGSELISPTDTYSRTYDTRNLKTFGRNTLETLPHLDHYRNLLSAGAGGIRKRPTLLELHEQDKAEQEGEHYIPHADVENAVSPQDTIEEVKVQQPAAAIKFGWVKGVLVRCLLNIWGVMLFLRLSWVVGQAGIGYSTVIILLSGVVTTITAMSMSAICTNGEVKGGGAYYMISRSLGPEFGGAIGLIFSVANAVAVAMYVVGFAETIRDILLQYDCLMVDEVNDVRIIGLITCTCLLGIALLGMEWEAKAQLALLAILLLAIANFAIGTLLPPSADEYAKSFEGYQGSIFVDNLGPDFRDGESFFSVFSIFFPAATGILAGANISGDLADAQMAIPKGTFWAIFITTLTYIAMAWMVGTVSVRDASGMLSYVVSTVTNDTGSEVVTYLTTNQTVEGATVISYSRTNCTVPDCEYGLQNDMQVMQMLSGWGPIIIAGIISATLSSALASLVSAPKVFQAVCKDKIFPYIHVFARGYGKSEEPRLAYLLAFAIGMACICIGDLNAIAPLISNFFLMSYTLINYSCFDASLAKSPGWRPAFRFYSMWISLLGSLLCLGVMFVINWWSALITFTLVAALYLYVHYRRPEINWGSSMQAHVYRNALQSTTKLIQVEEHVKNFRPQVLVLSGFPSERPTLVDFASSLSKNVSLMVCGHVLRIREDEQAEDQGRLLDPRSILRDAYLWLKKRRTKAFYNPVMASTFRQGTQALLQCCGTGKLRPNTLLLGFKGNWRTAPSFEVEEYFQIIHDAFDLRYAVGILRLQEGFHTAYIPTDEASVGRYHHRRGSSRGSSREVDMMHYNRMMTSVMPKSSSALDTGILHHRFDLTVEPVVKPTCIKRPVTPMEDGEDEEEKKLLDKDAKSAILLNNINTKDPELDALVPDKSENQLKLSQVPSRSDKSEASSEGGPGALKPSPAHNMPEDLQNRFSVKQKKGTIDVWWLFDDGGLTLLLPYILTTKSHWQNCKLRVFTPGTKRGELDREQRNLATLLSKFRIDCQGMTVLPEISKPPSEDTRQEYQELIKDWKMDEAAGETEETHPWKISESLLSIQKDKTIRHLRLRELLKQHSSEARLIVMTLPMPRKGLCNSSLYMSWIETLTKDMPPILLLRGNQESVLTYYS